MYRKVSIHLMLLFITTAGRTFLVLLWFQYISCYSLSGRKIFLQYNLCVSIHLMLLFIRNRRLICLLITCFNTSHVTLYPEVWIEENIKKKFQYISCYSLSPRFIGFSSSNSFYNTAKYKGLQDFYQSTSHFLFTQSKPGIPPYFQYFSFFYENPPGNFYNFSFNLLKEFPCHVFTLTGEFFYYKIKSSPLSFFPFPSTSSPNTLSFINFIIHTKSSSLSITRFSSFLNCMNFDGVMSPLKTDFWK